MQKPRVLVCDVDDTVCPSTQPISPELATVLRRLSDQGMELVFISGSTVQQIHAQLSEALGAPHHLMGASGSHYVRVRFGSQGWVQDEVYRHGFSPEQRERAMAAMRQLIQSQGLKPLTSSEDQLQDRGTQITLSILGRHAPEAAKRALDPDGAKRRAWTELLKPSLGDDFSIRVGGTTSIDVTPAGVDKGWGLRRLLDLNHFEASHCLYLGDRLEEGGNDYPARAVLPCHAVSSPADTLALLRQWVP